MTTNINIDASAYVKKTDLPSNLTLYPTTTASDIAMYFKLVTEITDPDYDSPAVDVATGAITGSNQLISSLATSAGILTGNPGIFTVSTVGNIRRTSGSGEAEFYFEIYQRNASGTETLIATSNATSSVSNSTYEQFNASALFNNGTFLPTDRIVLKFYGSKVGGGSNPSYQFQFGGTEPVRTIVPVPASVLLDVPIQVGVTEVVGGTSGKVLSNNSGVVGDIAIDTTPTNGSTNLIDSNAVYDGLAAKQDTLQSGTNIKTVLGDSLLGNGDVTIDLDDLSNVDSTGKNTGDVLEWNAVSGKWEAATPSGGGGGTPAGSSGEIQFNDSGSFGADSAFVWDNTNKRLGVGASPASTVRLDVRAQGALSTDIAFRVRNSADTADIIQVNGDSSISIGSSSTGITSSGYPYISLGVSAKSSDRGISIGTNAGKNQNNSNLQNIFIGHDTGGGASTITGAMNIGIGSGALRSLTSGTENIAIGGSIFGSQAGSSITSGSQNTLIGRTSGYQVTTGNLNTAVGHFSGTGITSGVQNTQIGANVTSSINSSRVTSIGSQLRAGHSGAIMIGSAVNASGSCQSLTADALHVFFGVGDNNQSFYVNNNTNVVLKSHVALTPGTHFEVAATNTITIHNGTAPVANITDAYAQYSADITSGNAAPHFRTENGAIIKLYQQSSAGITTVSDLVTILQNVGLLS